MTGNLGLQTFIVTKLYYIHTNIYTPTVIEKHWEKWGDTGRRGRTLFVTRKSLKMFQQKTENFMIYPFKRKIICVYFYGNNTQDRYLGEEK